MYKTIIKLQGGRGYLTAQSRGQKVAIPTDGGEKVDVVDDGAYIILIRGEVSAGCGQGAGDALLIDDETLFVDFDLGLFLLVSKGSGVVVDAVDATGLEVVLFGGGDAEFVLREPHRRLGGVGGGVHVCLGGVQLVHGSIDKGFVGVFRLAGEVGEDALVEYLRIDIVVVVVGLQRFFGRRGRLLPFTGGGGLFRGTIVKAIHGQVLEQRLEGFVVEAEREGRHHKDDDHHHQLADRLVAPHRKQPDHSQLPSEHADIDVADRPRKGSAARFVFHLVHIEKLVEVDKVVDAEEEDDKGKDQRGDGGVFNPEDKDNAVRRNKGANADPRKQGLLLIDVTGRGGEDRSDKREEVGHKLQDGLARAVGGLEHDKGDEEG